MLKLTAASALMRFVVDQHFWKVR